MGKKKEKIEEGFQIIDGRECAPITDLIEFIDKYKDFIKESGAKFLGSFPTAKAIIKSCQDNNIWCKKAMCSVRVGQGTVKREAYVILKNDFLRLKDYYTNFSYVGVFSDRQRPLKGKQGKTISLDTRVSDLKTSDAEFKYVLITQAPLYFEFIKRDIIRSEMGTMIADHRFNGYDSEVFFYNDNQVINNIILKIEKQYKFLIEPIKNNRPKYFTEFNWFDGEFKRDVKFMLNNDDETNIDDTTSEEIDKKVDENSKQVGFKRISKYVKAKEAYQYRIEHSELKREQITEKFDISAGYLNYITELNELPDSDFKKDLIQKLETNEISLEKAHYIIKPNIECHSSETTS